MERPTSSNSTPVAKPTGSNARQANCEDSRPNFWEVFAGCSRLSLHFSQANFDVLPIDHESNEHTSSLPQLLLELRDKDAQQVLLQRMDKVPPQLVHFAMPCGTGSRARDRKIPLNLRKRGAPEPPPLRSAAHPLGIPNLSKFHQAKVESANLLLFCVVAMLEQCYKMSIHVVLENPARSWIWAALAEIIRRHSNVGFRQWYNNLFDFSFSACEHGGGRPKETRFLTSIALLLELERKCSGNHEHLPYNISWKDQRWNFDTSKEAEYPHLLCQRYVALVCKHFKLPVVNTGKNRAASSLATAQQPKIAQLIPEFIHIQILPKAQLQNLKSAYKVLETLHPQGEDTREGQEQKVRVGKYHSMASFFNQAKHLQHPFSAHNAVSDEVKTIIFKIFSEGIPAVAKERIQQIERISKMKQELRVEEARFKANLPQHVREVLGDKPILLWRKLLQETNFPDLSVVDFMEGVPLTGQHEKSPLFQEKAVLAKTSTEYLVESAIWRNKALMARVAHSDEPELQKVLWAETLKECEKGFIKGPFKSLQQVQEQLGTRQICLTRRFVIMQGSGEEIKPRVIDDAKESAVNSAYTALEKLELHDFDHMVSIASMISAIYGGDGKVRLANQNGDLMEKPIHKELLGCRWLGRCLDLSKAYKQVPIDAKSRGLMVLLVPEPNSQEPRFFTTSSMPFGCAASVFAFNRITRSLLHLFHRLLRLPSGVFYDDFALMEPAGGATLGNMAAENLLDLLGWKYAKEGSKALAFKSNFNLLGAQLNLEQLHTGQITVGNKPSRISKLKELLLGMEKRRRITRPEAQSMHGLLNYASGFFLGNSLKTASRAFSNLISGARTAEGDEVVKLCEFTTRMLDLLQPRSWNCWGDDRPILVFTDGAFEDPEGTWGAVIFDPSSDTTSTFAGRVSETLMDGWKKLAGEQIICQIEAYAVLLVRHHFKLQWKNRKAIFFVDNEAARFSLIKGSSPSPSMQFIAYHFHQIDCSSPLMVWIERVPSASNVADLPSRGKWQEAVDMVGGSFEGDIHLPKDLIHDLLAPEFLPINLLRKTHD